MSPVHRWLPPFLVFLVAALAAGLPPSRAGGLEVVPSLVDLQVRPGRKQSGTIVVSGDFARPTRIRVYKGDWNMGPQGDPVFYAPGTQPRSLSTWLSFSPVDFVLSRERRQVIRYTLQAPEGITGSYWGALFFETVPPGDTPGGLSVQSAIRLVTVIYATSDRGSVLDGRLKDVSASYDGGSLSMSGRFENLGNSVISLTGGFALVNKATGKAQVEASFGHPTVLPGGARELSAGWSGELPPGVYEPCLTADYGRRISARGPAIEVR